MDVAVRPAFHTIAPSASLSPSPSPLQRRLRRGARHWLLMLAMLFHASAPHAADGPGEAMDDGLRLDINRATADEMAAALPGIGAVKAAAIVAYRDTQGPFLSVDDLLAVSGIGPRTLERLRPLVSIGDALASAAGERERLTVQAVRRVVERSRRQALAAGAGGG